MGVFEGRSRESAAGDPRPSPFGRSAVLGPKTYVGSDDSRTVTNTCILYADPDGTDREEVIEGLRADLSDLDPTFVASGSLADAESVLEDRSVDCVVTEYDLGDGLGIELINHARMHQPDTGGVLFSAVGYDELDTAIFQAPVTEYLDKDSPRAVTRLAELVRLTITRRTQISYPLPEGETQRLEALGSYDFDAEGLQRSLDRITELAARHLDASNAVVNLIEKHRQRFLATDDPSAAWDATSRADSVCTFTILDADRVLTVEDVTDDPRFETNDRLLGEGIRSYVGAPLVTSAGHVIGTVFAWSERPRSFDRADETYVRVLAEVTMDLIECHVRPDERGVAPTDGEGGP